MTIVVQCVLVNTSQYYDTVDFVHDSETEDPLVACSVLCCAVLCCCVAVCGCVVCVSVGRGEERVLVCAFCLCVWCVHGMCELYSLIFQNLYFLDLM